MRFTDLNLKKAYSTIFVNKTNFPAATVHGGCVLLPV